MRNDDVPSGSLYDEHMGKHYDHIMSWMLGTYLYLVGLRSSALRWYMDRARGMARRSSQAGGFFSENFLYLAVFSIPVAFLFYLLARKAIWPYAEDNIFPCFKDNGEDCFSNFSGNEDGSGDF